MDLKNINTREELAKEIAKENDKNYIILHIDPRIGKSIVSLALAEEMFHNEETRNILITTPRIDVENGWKQNMNKHFYPTSSYTKNDVFFLNYRSFHKLYSVDILILDECHLLTEVSFKSLLEKRFKKIIFLSGTLSKEQIKRIEQFCKEYTTLSNLPLSKKLIRISHKDVVNKNWITKPKVNIYTLTKEKINKYNNYDFNIIIKTKVYIKLENMKSSKNKVNINLSDFFTKKIIVTNHFYKEEDVFAKEELDIFLKKIYYIYDYVSIKSDKSEDILCFYNTLMAYLKEIFLETTLEKDKINWLVLGVERKNFIEDIKTNIVKIYLERQSPNKSILVFMNSNKKLQQTINNTITSTNKLSNKQNNQLRNDFNNKSIKILGANKKLDMGVDLYFDLLIWTQLSGSTAENVQKFSRCLISDDVTVSIFIVENSHDEKYKATFLKKLEWISDNIVTVKI